MEKDYEIKLKILSSAILKHGFDVIALQEIMQPIEAKTAKIPHINCGKVPLKQGNHALNIVNELNASGGKFNLAWIGFKRSYGRFDEGLAIITPHEISVAEGVTLSLIDDYENWKTRKALGVKIFGKWFYSVHFGWWDSFSRELESLTMATQNKKSVWLLGDFNAVASERNKGYDLMLSSGWHDTYVTALNKDDGITANTLIDGWNGENKEIRIDYIFTNESAKIESSFVIFNGKNEPIISDHYGIFVKTGEE